MIAKLSKLLPFGLQVEVPPGTGTAALSRAELLAQVAVHKLVLVRGLGKIEKRELLALAAPDPARDLVHWNFGPVMEMKVDPKAENYLFSRECVPFHWDGAFHIEPRVLLFHCLEAPNREFGGQTIFSDSEAIWNQASAAQRNVWKKVELTFETEKKAHYGGRITRPLVQHHPDKPATILRFAEPVTTKLNPVSLEVKGLKSEFGDFLEEMRGLLYGEQFMYEHHWQENDLLLADNFSLLHGRREFSDSSPRHLRRLQIR